ncbi:MAG: Eco57I restriction-modification methylase domain-containing protein [Muribaculaceae bacterium]
MSASYSIKRNERDWAGQLISWLKDAIANKSTSFEDATNDSGVATDTGHTKFPDILLFIDKTSGIVFNGWELKFPDTAVDDPTMLANALEKARRLKAESFVTWNGSEAVIWKVTPQCKDIASLIPIKRYPPIEGINSRLDLADPAKYAAHEAQLKARALEILHHLNSLYLHNELRPAINIANSIIEAIKSAHTIIVPQMAKAIDEKYGCDSRFRKEYNKWRIYENVTIRMLADSSRRKNVINTSKILANFTFYNLIGKILFYLTLSENLSGVIPPLEINADDVKKELNRFFNTAKEIDFQAVFKPYFTDEIEFSRITSDALRLLIEHLCSFDFKVLPTDVIGTILANVVPAEEKQQFGQYFTSEILAHLVAFPAVDNRNACVFDPTCGTGAFLCAFYNILNYFGCNNHIQALNQIWGNDISHFPSILSVINLYKQDVTCINNFPRVVRNDFFNLSVNQEVTFPKADDFNEKIAVRVPLFDGIAGNFPFIQQEDIPGEQLSKMLEQSFGKSQDAFIVDNEFRVNERADFFTYCFYHAFNFLKPNGIISAITSNAWLGKEYGSQFKRFLLDNFSIKYIVRSKAEHWFHDSFVSTVYVVIQKSPTTEPTRFVTLNFKLNDHFATDNHHRLIEQIDHLYAEIDNCDVADNPNWHSDPLAGNLYHSNDGRIDVSVVSHSTLRQSIDSSINWMQFFISDSIFDQLQHCMINYHPNVAKVIRGERTGWNPMFIISGDEAQASGISRNYLKPYIKSPAELQSIAFTGDYQHFVFVCDTPIDQLDQASRLRVERFANQPNTNGSSTVAHACSSHKPFWYSICPKSANIVTAINPYERLFFSFSDTPFIIDQRLIALQVASHYNVELIAALLNSAISLISIELKGVSRNLGALDLNANFLKTMAFLNPDLLSPQAADKIIEAFQPLKTAPVQPIAQELARPERIAFDSAVFEAYGLSAELLPYIYELLITLVTERTSLKNK